MMSTGTTRETQHHPEEGKHHATALDSQPVVATQLICPKCTLEYSAGTLFCTQCGTLFTTGDATALISNQANEHYNKPATGSLLAKQTKPVFLEIGDQKIELPNQMVIVLGRSANDFTSTQPDVALNDYGAAEKGVSRSHARITRYYNLLYITDMGSRNGTFLNRQPLVNNNARLLHNGDEILLGSLRLYVKF